MQQPDKFARPYAKAIFHLAQRENTLEQWSASLSVLRELFKATVIVQFVEKPTVPVHQKIEKITDAIGDQLSEQAVNLLKLLGQNHRLIYLPLIAEHYEQYKANALNTKSVLVDTAFALAENVKKTLTEKLGHKLNATINLVEKIDPTLLGGARIRFDNTVIDRTALGLINRLSAHITTQTR